MNSPRPLVPGNATNRKIVNRDEGNALLNDVPPIPTLSEALQIAQSVGTYDAPISSGADITRQVCGVRVANAARARVVKTALEYVNSSFIDRDLRDQDYVNYTYTANYAVHRKRDRRGYELPMVFGIAPKAQPRGILVAAPVRTGRRSLAALIESLFRREPIPLSIRSPLAGEGQYWKIPVLRIQWPLDGKIHSLARNFVGAFDTAMRTVYAQRTHSPFFRDRDILPALAALSIASNLGLLIVERINTRNACTRAAEITWDGLAQLTRMTGIPILCLATPGAAVAGLSGLSGALGDLAPTGPIEILPSLGHTDRYWIDVCRALYDATVGAIREDPMPEWFPKAAYELALGYPGVVAKALSYIAIELHALKQKAFTPEIFAEYGKKALLLDQGHLNAVAMIRQGGKYTDATLLRHGDWLSLGQLTSLAPQPQPI
ncbi:hypothetical protein SAMN05445504_3719 [Burkholderia sp. CF099]|nr:hypothetical protein SAMN05445504_3719 [Burkholderia sp. CF099]